MKKNHFKNQTGSLNIIIIAVVAIAFLAALGGGYYLMTKNKKAAKLAGETGEQAPQAVQDVIVDAPTLDFKLSPMPSLYVSSVILAAPAMPGGRMFPNLSVNSNFSYTGDTSIATPSITFDVPVPEEIKNPPIAPPPTIPTAPVTPPSGSAGQSTDCAQFASVPSCSMVGAPGTPGYDACKICYPSK